MELIFNHCGEFRWSPEDPVSQIYSPHLQAGAPGIFSDLLRSVQMLKSDNSFSNLSVTSPTSQLILQPFRRFTYVTAHYPTLPLLHLRHSAFSNPSFACATSQALHLTSPGDPPMQLKCLSQNVQQCRLTETRRSTWSFSYIKVSMTKTYSLL